MNSLDKLREVAKNLLEISEQIPKKIDWILRIDGHTDKVPINNEKFNSNWHLSTSRAINIVNFFAKEEFHHIDWLQLVLAKIIRSVMLMTKNHTEKIEE